jgi:hypothetical protein
VELLAKNKLNRPNRKTVAFGADPDHMKLIEEYMHKFGQTRPATMRRLMTVIVNEYDGVHLSRTKKV